MSSMQMHYVGQTSRVATRTSVRLPRRTFSSSGISHADQSEGDRSTAHPLRSTLTNQATFNRIAQAAGAQGPGQNNTSSQTPRPLIRRVDFGSPDRNARGTFGTQNRGGAGVDARPMGEPSGPLAQRTFRPKLGSGAAPGGTRRSGPYRSAGVAGSSPQRSARGGAGGPRSRPKRDFKGKKGARRGAHGGREGPEEEMEEELSPQEIAYRLQQAVDRQASKPAAVSFSLDDLVGMGPASLTNPMGMAELLHEKLALAAKNDGSKASYHPAMHARQLLQGKTVFFKDDKEEAEVMEYAQAWAGTAALRRTDAKGELVKPQDVTLDQLDQRHKTSTLEQLLTGKHAKPGTLGGEKVAGVMRDIWRQTSMNGTYLPRDERLFAKKAGSLIPSNLGRAAPAKGQATKEAVRE